MQLFHTHLTMWPTRCCYKQIFVPKDLTSTSAEGLGVEVVDRNSKEGEYPSPPTTCPKINLRRHEMIVGIKKEDGYTCYTKFYLFF